MMGKSKSGGGGSKARNDARRSGKSNKKHPGVAPKAHNGKTVDGYTPAKAHARATKRALVKSKVSE